MSQIETVMASEETHYIFNGHDGVYWIGVSKVGGGTVDNSYSGHWYVTITDDKGKRLNAYINGGEYNTNTPKTHRQVAEDAMSIWLSNRL